jgi:toxin ParE1/3/4
MSTWNVDLTNTAEQDYASILEWTMARFGAQQAAAYAEVLRTTFQTLRSGPRVPGARQRHDIQPGAFTLQAVTRRRSARHVLVFRISCHEKCVIEVLRILHDAMDLPRHIS